MSDAASKASRWWCLWVALLAVVSLVSFAPLLGLLAAGSTASLLGCALDEGSVHPCIVAGTDIGDALYTGAVMGWLAFVTWPGMLLALAGWAVFGIAWLRRRAWPR